MIKKLFIFLLLLSSSVYCSAEPLNYNTDVFKLEGKKKNYKCHSAHINYKTERGNFEKIDTTLTQDPDTKQWKQSKASYHCNIPEYADDWFEFYNAYEGANHTIKAKPVAIHVKGEYFNGKDGHGVIYKDAFGKGIDLKVYAYWHGLKKVIIINDKPSEISDMSFDFEMDMPSKVKDRQGNQWSKASKLDFKSKTLKIGEDGKESYFHNAMMWDSDKNRENVNIELYVKDGKTYLRKTIPKEFLEKAIYPVYTDHPTNYSPTAGDGDVQKNYPSWDTVHDASIGTSGYVAEYIQIGSLYVGNYLLIRGFLPIDTSGIDDSSTITSALLYLYALSLGDTDNDGDDWINVVQTSQASTDELVNDDYDQCGAIDNPTEGATRIDLGGITTSAYNSWTLNSTGIGWIDKVGVTKLGLREGHDAIDSVVAGYCVLQVSSSEDTSGTQDPYLDVTVESGGTPRRIIMID
jgi:hypothetical protein